MVLVAIANNYHSLTNAYSGSRGRFNKLLPSGCVKIKIATLKVIRKIFLFGFTIVVECKLSGALVISSDFEPHKTVI